MSDDRPVARRYRGGVSAQPPPGTPPPEVPDEFAEAYRAAYLEALGQQTTGPRHADVELHDDATDQTPADERWAHELPVRSGPPRDATHRDPDAEVDGVPRPRTLARTFALPEARWLAPVLLVLIAVALVVLAYVVGVLVG